MKKEIPLIITFVIGIIYIITFFVPHPVIASASGTLRQWFMVIAAFALILGMSSIALVHLEKISRKREGWGYSIVLILGLVVTAGVGIFIGVEGEEGKAFNYLFNYFYNPLSSTMFSLLAFFIASAAFRAFRAKTVEAALLLLAATLVMIGRVPLGSLIWDAFPDIATWIMAVPNTIGQRAIMIGAALGIVSASLKILIGIDRAYLGGGEE